VRPLDGLRRPPQVGTSGRADADYTPAEFEVAKVTRGGAHDEGAEPARASARTPFAPRLLQWNVGARAARPAWRAPR
jgi:hypothetical protein